MASSGTIVVKVLTNSNVIQTWDLASSSDNPAVGSGADNNKLTLTMSSPLAGQSQ